MCQDLVAALGLVICGLLMLPASSGAAESRREAPEKKATVLHDRTPDGTAYAVLSPLAKGPAPTLLLLATTGESTLVSEPYGRVGALLHGQGWNVVSLDLPCHGAQLRKGEPAELAGWAARTARGENIVTDLSGRASRVLDHLVKSRVADPERIAAAGTSRGGFMAFHVAAGNPRIRAVAGFAPVTDLLMLTEFADLKNNALAQQLALTNVAEKLADRAAWITIGNQDQRVGTDSATALAKALKQAAARRELPTNVSLQVLPVPGHTSLPEWHDQAAAWLLALPPPTSAPAAAQQKGTSTVSAPAASSQQTKAWLPEVKGLPRMRIEQRTARPLFTCQEKWEGGLISYVSVVRDKDAWHMWYESFDGAARNDVQRIFCYARSKDGVQWERPKLGRVEYAGNKDNNILMDGLKSKSVAGATVFLDEKAPAGERFKMVFIRTGSGGEGSYPICGATSPDGLEWRELPEPLLKGNFDTQNVCFRDGDVFRLYVRLWTRGRTVGYCQSPTFGSFPRPSVILSADDQDPEGMDFYDSAATKLAKDLYVMFPSAFYTKEKDGPVRPHMAVSRDGKDFQRVGHEAVLPMDAGAFDSTTIYVAPGVPGERPGTYWFYYVGYKTGHHVNYEAKAGGIGRFLLAVDDDK